MKVMVIVKATKNSEAGVMPNEKLLSAMGKYNEELVKAGIMLAGDGLHPSAKGKHYALFFCRSTSRRRRSSRARSSGVNSLPKSSAS